MKTYKEWAPTAYDTRGLGLPDRQDWFVIDMIRTRYSRCLEESNFASALKILGGESATVEVHIFRHWGPGWFEIILVHPSRETDGKRIEKRLKDYAVLDEHDLAEREETEKQQVWESMSIAERVQLCGRCGVSPLAARHDYYPADDTGAVSDYLLRF